MTLGRIHITIDDKLDAKFRDEVYKTYGMKKGNIKDAIEEAIQDWIKKEKKSEK